MKTPSHLFLLAFLPIRFLTNPDRPEQKKMDTGSWILDTG